MNSMNSKQPPRILLCLGIGILIASILAIVFWPRSGVECYESPAKSGIPCYWWGEGE